MTRREDDAVTCCTAVGVNHVKQRCYGAGVDHVFRSLDHLLINRIGADTPTPEIQRFCSA
jgi:hypothetical protein